MTHTIKFCPQHFPNGTLFSVNPNVFQERFGLNEFEVSGIVRNGPDSYVLKTNQFDEVIGTFNSFNIAHVAKIVRAGNGLMNIERSYYESNAPVFYLEDVERSELTQPAHGWKPRRGYYNTCSLQSVIHFEWARLGLRQVCIDYSKITDAVIGQPWSKVISLDRFTFIQVNKKRLRAFIKANANRFLMKVKRAVAIEERLDSESRESDEMDFIGDDYYSDQNMSLPTSFVTSFDLETIEVYKAAVAEFETQFPEHDGVITVSELDSDGKNNGQGSLWCDDRDQLKEFWPIYDKHNNPV